MNIDKAVRHQAEVAPKEDLAPFGGQWVALRKGHVVAHDRDLLKLLDDAEVRQDDVFMSVLDPRYRHFL